MEYDYEEEAYLVRPETLAKTPSSKDMSASVEAELRIFGAERCQAAGQMLRLPQVTIVSAQVIFHRFYFRKSFAAFDVWRIVAVVLFIATKMEETHRRLRDILLTVHALQSYDGGNPKPLDAASNAYSDLKAQVVKYERYVLRELGFEIGLVLQHPHKFILQYTKALVQNDDELLGKLAKSAWGYLNDSMRTTLCCRLPPHVIAVGSIALAARTVDLALPKEPAWWVCFDVQEQELDTVMKAVWSLYSRPKAKYHDVAKPTPQIPTPFPGTPAVMSPSPLAEDDKGPEKAARPDKARPPAALNPDRIQEMILEESNGTRVQLRPRPRQRTPERQGGMDPPRGRGDPRDRMDPPRDRPRAKETPDRERERWRRSPDRDRRDRSHSAERRRELERRRRIRDEQERKDREFERKDRELDRRELERRERERDERARQEGKRKEEKRRKGSPKPAKKQRVVQMQ